MKVAHRDDYDTHAVIGGNNVEEFGIAQTAEFFTVLSNTLYSNKPLAVIREVLCNAWDAHIVAGTTDRPVIVSVDEDKLSIRDFGPGIPHDMIHAIYCVYGNSTKENDGNQTGGFGLGSKSPFAYSDHFTVVNHHDGQKLVHAISRGSTMTDGKPDRRVMVQTPTTETGVEVIIPVKNRQDMHQFIEIARDIAAFGEMNVQVNGKQIEIVPISTAENNMFLTTRMPKGSYNKINIRYGNVIYPVQPDAEYIGAYQRLMKIMEDIPSRSGHGSSDFVLILQAPPNSISVTPSRESLSNTETTIKTLNRLFKEIIEHIQTGSDMFEEKLLTEHGKAIDYMVANGAGERVFFTDNVLTDPAGPQTSNDGQNVFSQITNMVELADYYLRYKKNISGIIKKKLLIQKVKLMRGHGFRRKHVLSKFLSYVLKTDHPREVSQRFHEIAFRPLVRHLAKHPVLKVKSLNIVQPSHRQQRFGWASFSDYYPDYQEFLPLLQGVVYVTHNKMAYETDLHDLIDGARNLYPNDEPRMVYVAPRTKGHKEEAIAFFEKHGFKVIDFASAYDEELAAQRADRPAKVRSAAPTREKKTGLVLLSHNVGDYNRFSINKHLQPDAPRSEDYTHVIKPESLSGMYKRFFPWGDETASDIAKIYGDKIGICVSGPQYDKQRRLGYPDAAEMIAQDVCQKVLTDPGIRRHVENQKGLKGHSMYINRFIEMAKYSAILSRDFGLPETHTEDDLIFWEIFSKLKDAVRYGPRASYPWSQIVHDTKEEVENWQPAPEYAVLDERINASFGLRLLDLYDMETELRYLDKVNPDYGRKVFIETTIINALNLRK